MRGCTLLSLWMGACTTGKAPTDTATPDDTGAETGETEDSGEVEAPATPSADRCDRVIAGTGSYDHPLVALSAAHATVRLFGPGEDLETADAALVTAIEAGGTSAPDLAGYAAELDLCLLPEGSDDLGTASARLHGALAWVSPGSGELALPEGATGVVIDLRNLTATDDLPAALQQAAGLALATEVPGLDEQVRQWYGMVDQVFSRSNVYSTDVVTRTRDPILAGASADLPLVLVTDDQLPPEAAAFAATLASAGRAWIVGEDVMTEVAELSWAALDGEGIAVPTRRLQGAEGCLPDAIPATVRAADPEELLEVADLSTWDPPAALSGDCTRPELPSLRPWSEGARDEVSTEAVSATALLVAHGNMRRFFPYFDVVGDTIDEGLVDLFEVVPLDRLGQLRQIARLGAELHDGHVFFGDMYGSDVAGYLPVTLDHVAGRPVVAQTGVEQLQPGDTITAVNGEPIEDLYAFWGAYHQAATEGYTLDLIGRELWYMDDTTTYTVEDADGVSREEVIEPQPAEAFVAVPFVFHTRANGRLDDLGAADVAYLNLSDAVTTSLDEVEAAVLDAGDASGLVVDMRGYPGVDIYSIASMLHTAAYRSPVFLVRVWTGPDQEEWDESQYDLDPGDVTFDGPIALLTSPITVSAAENFSMMLTDLPHLTVVGRNSAGTNGNITGMQLPGGFYLSFTGMGILFPDGSTFHGVGMVPDVEVSPTAADYAEGRDPELEAAIEVITGG